MYFSSVIKMLCKASLPKCCMRLLKPINSWKLLNSVESYLVKMMIFYFPKIKRLWELYPWIFCLWSMLKIGVSVCLLLCCAWCGSLPGTDWVSQLTFSVFYAVTLCLLCSFSLLTCATGTGGIVWWTVPEWLCATRAAALHTLQWGLQPFTEFLVGKAGNETNIQNHETGAKFSAGWQYGKVSGMAVALVFEVLVMCWCCVG